MGQPKVFFIIIQNRLGGIDFRMDSDVGFMGMLLHASNVSPYRT